MTPVAIYSLDHAKDLPLPSYGSCESAGMDLSAAIFEDIIISPGQRTLIPTGVIIALPKGHEAQIRPRSGLALK
ncbi:MAG: dUTP diphosphatase, partial [Alphaproteobacteria bacterium]|nr:dUTP diphosphatase [Alphaproteobacteria bacterium]